jgi:hypothetical protein
MSAVFVCPFPTRSSEIPGSSPDCVLRYLVGDRLSTQPASELLPTCLLRARRTNVRLPSFSLSRGDSPCLLVHPQNPLLVSLFLLPTTSSTSLRRLALQAHRQRPCPPFPPSFFSSLPPVSRLFLRLSHRGRSTKTTINSRCAAGYLCGLSLHCRN